MADYAGVEGETRPGWMECPNGCGPVSEDAEGVIRCGKCGCICMFLGAREESS